MDVLKKRFPEIVLRLGLGLTYIYSGIELAFHPTGWGKATVLRLPYTIQQLIEGTIGIEPYVKVQGMAELLFAVILLAWFLPRWLVRLTAILVSIQLVLILVFVGVSLDTFRDMGLLGASLALFFVLAKPHAFSKQV